MAESVNLFVARGDAPPQSWPLLRSQLPGVSDDAWTRFVRALETQPLDAVTGSGSLGCYEMRPKSLVDLGLMANLRTSTSGALEGDFFLPLTQRRFLASPVAQFNALCDILERFDADIGRKGVLGLSRSGALAVLHRAGRGGLKHWGGKKRWGSKVKHESTLALVTAVEGIF